MMAELMSEHDLWRRRFEAHLQHANFLEQQAIDRDIFEALRELQQSEAKA